MDIFMSQLQGRDFLELRTDIGWHREAFYKEWACLAELQCEEHDEYQHISDDDCPVQKYLATLDSFGKFLVTYDQELNIATSDVETPYFYRHNAVVVESLRSPRVLEAALAHTSPANNTLVYKLATQPSFRRNWAELLVLNDLKDYGKQPRMALIEYADQRLSMYKLLIDRLDVLGLPDDLSLRAAFATVLGWLETNNMVSKYAKFTTWDLPSYILPRDAKSDGE